MKLLDQEIPFTHEEIIKAYGYWRLKLGANKMDYVIHPLLTVEVPFDKGWLKHARGDLFLSQTEVSQRLKISKEAYCKLEKREAEGQQISIDSLKKAAEALDCELVYFLRRKDRKAFSAVVWQKLMKICLRAPRFLNTPVHKRPISLASLAFEVLRSSNFRKKHGLNKVWERPTA